MADEKKYLSRLIKFLDTFKTEIKLGERWNGRFIKKVRR